MNNNQQSSIDFNDAWVQLKPQLEAEAERREKKKRRIIFFWWSVTGIAVLGAMSLVINYLSLNKGQLALNNKTEMNYELSNISNDANNTGKAKRKLNIVTGKLSDKVNRITNDAVKANNKITNPKNSNQFQATNNNRQKSITERQQETRNEKQYNKQPQILNSKQINQTVSNEKPETRNINNLKILKPANPSLQIIPALDSTNGITLLPVPEKKKAASKNAAWGLRFNVPVLFGANSLDYNANAQPLTLLIPTVFVNKAFSKQHSLQVQLNPYSQYFLNNNAVVKNEVHNITLQQGSNINNTPQQIEYNEITTVNKIISVEFGLSYQYQLTNKIKAGIGLYDNIVMAAVLQNAVVKDKKVTTQTKNFGITNNDKEWNYINNNFIVGRLEAMYQYKKFDVGISISKPLSNMFNNIQTNVSPLNTNLFLQYRF